MTSDLQQRQQQPEASPSGGFSVPEQPFAQHDHAASAPSADDGQRFASPWMRQPRGSLDPRPLSPPPASQSGLTPPPAQLPGSLSRLDLGHAQQSDLGAPLQFAADAPSDPLNGLFSPAGAPANADVPALVTQVANNPAFWFSEGDAAPSPAEAPPAGEIPELIQRAAHMPKLWFGAGAPQSAPVPTPAAPASAFPGAQAMGIVQGGGPAAASVAPAPTAPPTPSIHVEAITPAPLDAPRQPLVHVPEPEIVQGRLTVSRLVALSSLVCLIGAPLIGLANPTTPYSFIAHGVGAMLFMALATMAMHPLFAVSRGARAAVDSLTSRLRWTAVTAVANALCGLWVFNHYLEFGGARNAMMSSAPVLHTTAMQFKLFAGSFTVPLLVAAYLAARNVQTTPAATRKLSHAERLAIVVPTAAGWLCMLAAFGIGLALSTIAPA